MKKTERVWEEGWWVAEFAESAARDQHDHSKSAHTDPVDPDQHAEMWKTKQLRASPAKSETSSCFMSPFLKSLWWSVSCLHGAGQRAASPLAHARTHTHSDSLTHTDTHSSVLWTATLETLCTGGLALRVLMISHSEVSCSHARTHTCTRSHTRTHWTACRLCVLRTLSGDKRSSLWLWLGSSGSFVCT